jgi:hypothetical protein
MAVYKVIQDIEAEDKLVGPLTLKQFIYGGISAVCLYICFLAITKHFDFIIIPLLPIALLSGFFAFPWDRDQPTEIWALAKIRFLFKPRRRIWDQSGIKELVTITAPKREDNNYTNGLSQPEVKSRLRALADTIDSRGWVVKNVNVNLNNQPLTLTSSTDSERLIDPASLPQPVPTVDVSASDDIMDEGANPIAQHFDQMIKESELTHRQHVIQEVKSASQDPKAAPVANNYWFMNQPDVSAGKIHDGDVMFSKTSVVAPGSNETDLPIKSVDATPEEEALAKRIKTQALDTNPENSHLRVIQPLSSQNPVAVSQPVAPVTQLTDPVILGLVNNNDRSVASIAREINKTRQSSPSADEVVISLH